MKNNRNVINKKESIVKVGDFNPISLGTLGQGKNFRIENDDK